ncbi:MAG TPA: CARDB domain-containing protein [Vicinamibacteria bacterium]|nr:CARDB domain-containing protein [Vicinamibacteria bacterium]
MRALAPGATADVPVSTGGADVAAFRVTVDRDGRVRESNEANNTAAVRCPPPVG